MNEKTKTKPKKSDKASEASTSSETSSGATAETSVADSGSSTKSSTPSRTTSYFSSVSTDEYRNGWAAIFDNKKPGKTSRPRKAKQAAPSLPMTIELSGDDLDAATKQLLTAALRKKARKDKLNLGRTLSKATLAWTIECDISE